MVGREAGRDADHQLRIDDGDGGKGEGTAKADLLVSRLVGDHGPGVGLRTRAGRGGDGNDGQCLLYRLALARAAYDVVPVVAGVACHDGDALGRVDGASAAQAHNEVALLVTADGGSLHDVLLDRVGQDLVEDDALDVVLFQIADDLVQIAIFLHRCSTGDDDHRLLARHRLGGQFLELTASEQQLCRNVQIECLLCVHVHIKFMVLISTKVRIINDKWKDMEELLKDRCRKRGEIHVMIIPSMSCHSCEAC